MKTQTLAGPVSYRIAPSLPVYNADDLLHFADETDELKKTGGLISWDKVKDRVRQKYGLSA